MELAIVVAIADNNVIGKDNQLIWYMPQDLKHFKSITMGFPIIMGRKTYESIGKPLPGRTSIVVTRQTDYLAKGCVVVQSITEAIAKAEEHNQEKAFVIGGAEIYQQAMDVCDTIYLTRIRHSFEGDTFFPEIDLNHWIEEKRESFPADDKNPYPFDFIMLTRKQKGVQR
jgi:dihydrofolate reductase